MEKTSTKPAKFLFERPEYVPSLSQGQNIILVMGALATRIKDEERTRTIHVDGRRENVAEHSFMLAKVAPALAARLYPWMDRGRVTIHANNHDDPEAYVGDTPTDTLANHDPETKVQLEAAGVEQLIADFFDLAPEYVADVVAYEEQEEYEAQFVRIVDKIMVLLIHIPNEGAVLREHYTYEALVQATYETEQRLLDQYPHFIELIEMRTELASYIHKKYVRDWPAASPATAGTTAAEATATKSATS